MKEHPGTQFMDVMRILADKWKTLSDFEKEKYTALAEKDKLRYKEEVEAKASEKVDPTIRRDKNGMPKKPPSAYLLFAADKRKSLRKRKPEASLSDIMRAVSLNWAKLSPDKESKYNEKAKEEKERYAEALREWE